MDNALPIIPCSPDKDVKVPAGYRRVRAEVPFAGQTVVVAGAAKDAPARLSDIMPLAWSVSEQLNAIRVQQAQAQGTPVTCRPGCSACCVNFLRAVSPPEAFRIVADMATLSGQQLQRVDQRFQRAAAKFSDSGLSEIQATTRPDGAIDITDQIQALLTWWNANKFPCPLLQDNRCCMYESRPIACRDFMVTSPPELCDQGREQRLPRPMSVFQVLLRWSASLEDQTPKAIPLMNMVGLTQAKMDQAQKLRPAQMLLETFCYVLIETGGRRAELAANAQT